MFSISSMARVGGGGGGLRIDFPRKFDEDGCWCGDGGTPDIRIDFRTHLLFLAQTDKLDPLSILVFQGLIAGVQAQERDMHSKQIIADKNNTFLEARS
jgi:hypothetical protein